jgi:hypothetical protein
VQRSVLPWALGPCAWGDAAGQLQQGHAAGAAGAAPAHSAAQEGPRAGGRDGHPWSRP